MLVHPYASRMYADAFAPLEPLWLPGAGTHVLKRSIPNASAWDAMGCYPLCVMQLGPSLEDDFSALSQAGLVSLVTVTDVLTQPSEEALKQHFPHLTPFKLRFLHDPAIGAPKPSKHHRYEIKQARAVCEVAEVKLADHLDAWCAAYDTLVQRHHITGIQAFSSTYFEAIAAMPELVTIAAFVEGEFVSAHLWMRYENLLYSHLAASTQKGYDTGAAYAVYDETLIRFGLTHTIDFGGAAGSGSSGGGGLDFFKKGFANRTARNYIAGRVLNAERYQKLSGDYDAGSFFPAYRAPR